MYAMKHVFQDKTGTDKPTYSNTNTHCLMTNNRTMSTFNTLNSFYRTKIKLRYLIILSLLTCKAGVDFIY